MVCNWTGDLRRKKPRKDDFRLLFSKIKGDGGSGLFKSEFIDERGRWGDMVGLGKNISSSARKEGCCVVRLCSSRALNGSQDASHALRLSCIDSNAR